MNKYVFHSATIGGQLFEALMTDEGPFIWESTPKKGFHDGVCLGVCQIRRFDPGSLDSRLHNGLGWYIVKYDSEVTVFLNGFSERDARELSKEFGINLWDDNFGRRTGQPFYSSKAWDGLKAWVSQHPKMAKMHGTYAHAYLPDWYGRAAAASD